MFGQMEVPQVFERDGRWYCLFCTAAEHWSEAYRRFSPQPPVSGTHYLVAEHPLGPWEVARGDFFDGATPCRRYAGKLAETEGRAPLHGVHLHHAQTPSSSARSATPFRFRWRRTGG